MKAEIICIGNELLIGKTVNTNATWLAGRITRLGGEVKTITTIGDELGEIQRGISQALSQDPTFLITTGGLGPTYDDKTLDGVARILGQKLVINKEALGMVREKYYAYHREGRMEKVEITPARRKMAILPEAAEPLPNPVGTAPGITIDFKNSTIICLPGVPPEMKAIFNESVAPMIREKGGKAFYERAIHIDGIMESALAPIIDKAVESSPRVYIKSHPKGEERKPNIEIHFSTISETEEEACDRLDKAVKKLKELIEEEI